MTDYGSAPMRISQRCFFFSSRRRHTRLTCDWSSDVCSSDLLSTAWPRRCATMGYLGVKTMVAHLRGQAVDKRIDTGVRLIARDQMNAPDAAELLRSEERRVGKECRLQAWPYPFRNAIWMWHT